MALRWERHREQQKEVRPGSLEEQQALASIDTAREEEIRREEARGRGLLQGAQFVSHRYSGGHLTEIYRVARGRFAEVS